MKMRGIFFLFLLIISIVGCLNPRHKTDDVMIDRAIQNEMEKYRIPSISTCIIKGDRIIWKRAYGYANIQRKVPAAVETIYLLASVSKQVTSVAVMQLHEKGAIDIDKDINNYLPFPVRNPKFPGQVITPRILLTHRAGLAWPQGEDPDFYRIYTDDTAPGLGKWLKNYIIPGGSEYNLKIWKDTKAGEVELYSNIGVALLGFLVESVSGKDFNSYCIENIFLPLEMPNTSFRTSGLNIEKLAMPYYENLTPCGHYSVPFYPSTTIKSSIAEFSHFLIAMMNGGVYKGKRVLKERTVKEILKVQYANSWLGLLWWKYEGDWYGGEGGFLGASTYMAFKKDKNIGILIFSNRTEFNSFYPPDGRIFTLIKNKAETFFFH